MAQDVAIAEFNTFVQGLITEASPLIFPENAALDIQNVVLNREGSFQRRLGIDYETDYAFTDTGGYPNSYFQTNNVRVDFYRWDNVSNDPGLSFGVVRLGRRVWLMDLTSSNPSANLKNGGTFETITGLDEEDTVQFSPIGGDLAMTVGKHYYILLQYDKDADNLSDKRKRFKVRDLWGVDDGLDADERPGTLSNNHKYNLQNQGWPDENYKGADGAFRFPYNLFLFQEGKYPSNADIWHYGLRSDGGDGFEWVSQGMGLK